MPPHGADAPALRHAEAQEWAAFWAQRWFLDQAGDDRFRIGEIDAGWATHVEAYLILLRAATDAVSGHHRPARSPSSWLKAHGFDRAIRAALLRRMAGPALEHASTALIVEIPTPSMLGPATHVALGARPDAAVAAADPRAMRALRGRGLRPHPLVTPGAEERRLRRDAQGAILSAWSDLQALPPHMPLGDVDLAGSALARLGPLVRRSMPYLAAEGAAIDRFLDTVSPAGVGIASDQHRIGRLVVAAARRRRIRSVVIQHGLPQATIGYLPVVADKVAAWSAASREWFIDGGTPADRIVVTGNPRTDALSAVSRPSGPSHVVLALSPTDPMTNERLVRDAVAALDQLPGARLTVKLHPGQGDWSFVRGVVREASDPGRVSVQRHEPLYRLLASASVVVVHRSSVAVEALVAQRPVLVHRVGIEPTTADLELADLRLRVTNHPTDLAAAIRELSQEEHAEQYLAERTGQIERVAGPTDGRTTERIVGLLRNGILDA